MDAGAGEGIFSQPKSAIGMSKLNIPEDLFKYRKGNLSKEKTAILLAELPVNPALKERLSRIDNLALMLGSYQRAHEATNNAEAVMLEALKNQQ